MSWVEKFEKTDEYVMGFEQLIFLLTDEHDLP